MKAEGDYSMTEGRPKHALRALGVPNPYIVPKKITIEGRTVDLSFRFYMVLVMHSLGEVNGDALTLYSLKQEQKGS